MCCIASENGEEADTTNRVNISIEFKEYENVLFNRKNEKEFKANYIKLVHMMSVKYLYHFLMTKDTF